MIALAAIFSDVIAPALIFALVMAFEAIDPAVTAPAASSTPVIALALIWPAVMVLAAISRLVMVFASSRLPRIVT